MNSTYTLLIQSEEKGRTIMEMAVYAMCVLSVLVTIWQFIWQAAPPSYDQLVSPTRPAAAMSQPTVQAASKTKS